MIKNQREFDEAMAELRKIAKKDGIWDLDLVDSTLADWVKKNRLRDTDATRVIDQIKSVGSTKAKRIKSAQYELEQSAKKYGGNMKMVKLQGKMMVESGRITESELSQILDSINKKKLDIDKRKPEKTWLFVLLIVFGVVHLVASTIRNGGNLETY
jgi:hypothetical protein